MNRLILLTVAALAFSSNGFAQEPSRFDVGGHLTVARIDALDSTDVGVSGRIAWYPLAPIGIEAEIGVAPSDLPDRNAITSYRVEGLFGVTAGPRLGRVRPFLRVRPGFLRIAAAPEPVACILIFPPPLSCLLAEGRTVFVADIGGGVTVDLTPRAFIRVDVGDRLVRYPGPAIGRGGRARDRSFVDHDLRTAIGAGWRF